MKERVFDLESVVNDICSSLRDGASQVGKIQELSVIYPYGRTISTNQFDCNPVASLDICSNIDGQQVDVCVGVFFDNFGFCGVEFSSKDMVSGKAPKKRKAKKALSKVVQTYLKTIAAEKFVSAQISI